MAKSLARLIADLIDSNGDVQASNLDNVVAFDAGTLLLFQQTNAPTGWTKQTTHNDKALRCVSGSCSSGGTAAFSTAMAAPSVSGSVTVSGAPDSGNLAAAAGNLAVSVSGNISNTTLSNNQIPSHSHNIPRFTNNNQSPNSLLISQQGFQNTYSAQNIPTANTGGSGSHNHAHNLSGNMTGAPTLSGSPGVGNLGAALSSCTASINVQYVDVILAAKD